MLRRENAHLAPYFFNKYTFPATSVCFVHFSTFHTFRLRCFLFRCFSCQTTKTGEKQSFCGFNAESCLTKVAGTRSYLISTCGIHTLVCTHIHSSYLSGLINKLKKENCCDPQRASQQSLWRCGGPICNHTSLYLDISCFPESYTAIKNVK